MEFSDTYQCLQMFHVGQKSYGNLELIQTNFLANEIIIKEAIPDYSYAYRREIAEVKISQNKLFIPLTYKTLLLIRKSYILLRLDEKAYYLDYFAFLANDVNFEDYKHQLLKGEITYA